MLDGLAADDPTAGIGFVPEGDGSWMPYAPWRRYDGIGAFG